MLSMLPIKENSLIGNMDKTHIFLDMVSERSVDWWV